MDLLVVDPTKCKRDGLCVDECPRLLIELRPQSPVPTPREGAESLCNNCGHCLAVCPHGALTLRTAAPAACPPVSADSLPSLLQVEHLLRTRRSIRTFKASPLPRETLAALVDVARYAPSAANRQPVRWLVIEDGREVRRVARLTEDWMRSAAADPASGMASHLAGLDLAAQLGKDYVCRGAPHLVVAQVPPGRQSDGVIALAYLEVAAYARGLGACWAGFVMSAAEAWPPLREALGLSESLACAGVMLVGYPRYRYRLIPPRDEPQIVWR